MPIINRPPFPQQLIVRRLQRDNLPRQIPRLLGTNEMNEADSTLEMLVGRNVLVVRTRRAIIREAQSMPVAEMHVEQALVSPVETDPTLSECLQRIVVLQIGSQHHDSTIEAIRPAHVWRGGKVYIQGEQLVRGPDGDDIAVDIHDSLVLGKAPKLDFGECGD